MVKRPNHFAKNKAAHQSDNKWDLTKKFSKKACEKFHDKADSAALTPHGLPAREICCQEYTLCELHRKNCFCPGAFCHDVHGEAGRATGPGDERRDLRCQRR